jgi:hypothetical protein
VYNPTSPVTGGPQTGLTSPTYTLTADVAPDATGKQSAVTSLGGTQTGVRTHGASDPFTLTGFRPKSFKTPGVPDPATGVIYKVGKNSWTFLTRKGTIPAANQSPSTMQLRTQIDVPSGADAYDSSNVRAACSAHFGLLWQQSSGIGDSLVTGIL